MPTTLTNYPNSFDKFYYECNPKCLPRYRRGQPLPDGNMPQMTFNIDKTPTTGGDNWQYLLIPYPCDKWECGGVYVDEAYWTIMQNFFANEFTSASWLQQFNLEYISNNVWRTGNTFGAGTIGEFETGSGYDVSNCNLYGDMCLVIVELQWNADFSELLASEIIGKSAQTYVKTNSILTQCGIIGINYVPDGFGFPVEYTGEYMFYTWGKVWKPTLQPTGDKYIKSNGVRKTLNMQLTEEWTLDVDMCDYSIHKAMNVALESNLPSIYNKDMTDFSDFNSNDYGYYMDTLIKETYTFGYVDKCFSSSRGKAIILNNQFSEGVSYNC